MTIDQLKNLLFRILHGFRGYPKEIHGIPFRVDESLRRFENGGEETVQEILNTQLKQGDLYVDVGANYGLHAMLAAHYVGETGRVFAFEPVPTNLRLLQRNLKLNGFQERSKVFPCALNSTVRWPRISGQWITKLSYGGGALSFVSLSWFVCQG
jgi:hypothetical protein